MKVFIIVCSLFFIVSCQNKKETVTVSDTHYTCSMHPQIIRDKPGKCPICHMDLISVDRKKTTAKNEIELSDEQIKLGNIVADTIKAGTNGSQSVFNATINFNEKNIHTISARLPGRIEKLFYRNLGEYIAKGSPVYNLYSEELNSAQQEYVLLLQQRKSLGNTVINFSQLVESARAKLLLWGMSRGQVQELERTHKTGITTTFYSNASGFITALDVIEGDYAMGGQSLVKLANLSTVIAEAQVYTSQQSQFDKTGEVLVQIPALGKEVIGKIEFINPEVNPQSRINLLRVLIPNEGNQLKPGMPAYIVVKSAKNNSITLPGDAVLKTKDMSMIWLKTGINTFKTIMVTTGMENGGKIEITNGLKDGDVVVISGVYLLNSEFLLRNGGDAMGGMPGMKM